MNFKDFHDYAKSLKPLVRKANELDCGKFLEELIKEHPEYKEKLDVVHSCYLDFQVIHSHLYDLANDAMQLERNYRARADIGNNPLGLKLTEKAKAMIPNKCPHCNCGLLDKGSFGEDFGTDECNFSVMRSHDNGYVLRVETINECSTIVSDSIKFCPICGRELQ